VGATAGAVRRGRHAAGVHTHTSPVAMVAVPVLAVLVVACGGAADDEGATADGAAATSDVADVASGGGTTSGQTGTGTTDASGRTAPEQQADGGQEGSPDQDQESADQDDDGAPERNRENAEEIDPFEELEWALTPAGPESPSVNEDSIYRVLDDLDPEACRGLLTDPADGWFDPGAFGTGERSVHLFRAGALLCAGDGAAADAAYRQALGFAWPFPVTQPLHSRVCNVWDAVTRMLDPEAGPCALEELADDEATATDADEDEPPDDASSEVEREEPTDTEGSADTDEPDVTDLPAVTDDPADELSENDAGS
jgi:hypothetical protein